MSARCTCGETACESELCDCDQTPCPVDHAFEAEVLREAAEKIRARAAERSAIPRDQLGSSECRDDWAADLIDPDKEGS